METLAKVHTIEDGLAHQDLKPSNLIVTGDGEPWILDLGLTRSTSQHLTTLPGAKVSGGTPGYMAPEVLECRVEKDKRRAVDVFALGIMLNEILTGRHPFSLGDAKNFVVIHERILAADPQLPGSLDSEWEHFDRFIERCLSKNPDTRYPHAQALLPDLQELVDHLPERSAPDEAESAQIPANETMELINEDEDESEGGTKGKNRLFLNPLFLLSTLFLLIVLGLGAYAASQTGASDSDSGSGMPGLPPDKVVPDLPQGLLSIAYKEWPILDPTPAGTEQTIKGWLPEGHDASEPVVLDDPDKLKGVLKELAFNQQTYGLFRQHGVLLVLSTNDTRLTAENATGSVDIPVNAWTPTAIAFPPLPSRAAWADHDLNFSPVAGTARIFSVP